MANPNAVSQDPSLTHLGTMHNFTIYKFRYRWQKRILQIDFLTKIIFNIEKGTMKKQFSFSQVKSVEDHDGMRFNITFHGHQNYELEASSHEDKQRLMQLLSMIIMDNEKPCTAPPPVRRLSQVGVLHEGLMELQKSGPNSEKWVKHLVKLREDELVLYCVDHNEGEPAEQVIQLSKGIVSSASHHGYPTFTLQSNGNHYVFRISVSEHNKAKVDMKKLTDNWVDLLSNYCTHIQSQPEEQSIYSRITDSNSNGTSNHTAEKQFAPGKKKTENQSLFANSPYAAISQVAVLLPANSPPPVTPNRAVFRGLSPLPPPLPAPYKSPSTRQTKALHWDQIPQEKINKSIWAVGVLGNKKINQPQILDQFSTTGKTTFQGNFSDSISTQKILLDHKIALNFNIILKGFNIAPSQLKDKLLIIHEKDGGLTNEQITTLRRYAPTLKDIKMYQSYNGSPSELHIVDQFMIEMCNIPNIGRRLDLLLNIRELPVCMKDLYPLILQITKACQQLLTSESFVTVLGYILAIGNCLNENTGKERVIGFRLSTLDKLPQLWGKERKFTLLHALVEQILLHEPDLTKFSSELTEFEAVPDASVKGLNAEVDVIRKQLGNIVEYSKLMKNKTPDQEQFYKQLKVIIQKCEEEYAQLSKRCEEMKKLYSDVLLKFGELQDQDSQELFGWISSFLNGFNKAYTEF